MNDFDPYHQWLGLQPFEQPPDHYRLLGLRRFEADPSTIQAATDERMALVRRYQTGPRAPFTQKLLNELATAKLCLLDPYSKAEYDASLTMSTSGAAPVADAMLPAFLTGGGTASQPLALPAQSAGPQVPSSIRQASTIDVDETDRGGWLPLLGVLVIVALGIGIWGATTISDRQSPPPINVPAEISQSERVDLATVPNNSANSASSSGTTVIMQEESGSIVFPLAVATLGGQVSVESRDVGDFLVGWQSDDDVATWRFKVVKLPSQGIFCVRLAYQASRSATNAEYVLTVDGEEQAHDVRAYDRLMEDEFYLAVKRGGEHTLNFFVRNLPTDVMFGLKMIELSSPRTVSSAAP